jgi:hypothetical protein
MNTCSYCKSIQPWCKTYFKNIEKHRQTVRHKRNEEKYVKSVKKNFEKVIHQISFLKKKCYDCNYFTPIQYDPCGDMMSANRSKYCHYCRVLNNQNNPIVVYEKLIEFLPKDLALSILEYIPVRHDIRKTSKECVTDTLWWIEEDIPFYELIELRKTHMNKKK